MRLENNAKLHSRGRVESKDVGWRCWDETYLASSARAKTAAASGAAAEVPECLVVHCPYRSVVACEQ